MSTPNFANVGDAFARLNGTSSRGAVNGRVDLLSPFPQMKIANYQVGVPMNNSTFQNEATLGQLALTEVGKLFFSSNNIEALQQGIRYRVYVESQGKYTVGRQSDSELKIVMRSVYYQNSKNQPTNIVGQVRDLNQLVLNWAVPDVLGNVSQYDKYRKDASTLPVPMDRSPIISSKGSRQLEIMKL